MPEVGSAQLAIAEPPAISTPKDAGAGAGYRDVIADSPGLVPCLLAIGILIWLGADDGGFAGTRFLPATLLTAAILAVSLTALPRPRPSRPALVAIALLAGYAAFSYLSIAWAGQKGFAWDGANRTVLYALLFALFALWPLRGSAAAGLVGLYGVAVAVIGVVELLRADAATSSIAFFSEGRLSQPLDYVNANVAFWFLGFWPCLVLAARREVHPLLRGVFAAAATILAGMTVLGESRAWLILLPVAAALVIALVPGRGRTIVSLGALAVAILALRHPLLDVYESFDATGPPGPELGDASRLLFLVSAGMGALGAVVGFADRRIEIAAGVRRTISASLVGVVLLACLGGVVAFTVKEGSPITAASDKWSEFTKGSAEPQFKESRFGLAVSTYRYDYWKVAWKQFERRPLTGAGADNFLSDYLKEGSSYQTPAYPHNVAIRALSETGLIGVVLLFGGFLAALAAALPGLRRPGLAAAASGSALMVVGYWFIHGQVDWLWEYPALGGIAFAMLGLSVAVAAGLRERRPSGRPLLSGRGVAVAAVATYVVLCVGVVPPWLAERDLREARSISQSDPDRALELLDRSASLNPLSPLADQTAGAIQSDRRQYRAAAVSFQRSLDREPNSFAHLQLGAIASVEDRPNAALREVRRALELAPRDTPSKDALRRLRRGKSISPQQVNRDILRDIDVRTGPS